MAYAIPHNQIYCTFEENHPIWKCHKFEIEYYLYTLNVDLYFEYFLMGAAKVASIRGFMNLSCKRVGFGL